MSDPLERLRGVDTSAEPDVDTIRARAGRIERRRRVVLSGGGVAVAVLAAIAIFVGAEPQVNSRRVAQAPIRTTAPQAVLDSQASGPRSSASAATAGRTSGDAQTSTDAQTEAAPAAGDAQQLSADSPGAQPLEITLEVEQGAAMRGADLTLRVCNPGAEDATRSFADGQRYDFVVEQDGESVWRWSDEMTFTRATGEERWAPGACTEWTEVWDGTTSSGAPAPPGSYDAVGILTSSVEERSARQTICLEVC